MLLQVEGYWKDDREYVTTVAVSLGSWDGSDDEDIFYYTEGDDIKVGDTIAGDFVILEIRR